MHLVKAEIAKRVSITPWKVPKRIPKETAGRAEEAAVVQFEGAKEKPIIPGRYSKIAKAIAAPPAAIPGL